MDAMRIRGRSVAVFRMIEPQRIRVDSWLFFDQVSLFARVGLSREECFLKPTVLSIEERR
jgi:hypothetical protein